MRDDRTPLARTLVTAGPVRYRELCRVLGAFGLRIEWLQNAAAEGCEGDVAGWLQTLIADALGRDAADLFPPPRRDFTPQRAA